MMVKGLIYGGFIPFNNVILFVVILPAVGNMRIPEDDATDGTVEFSRPVYIPAVYL